jgi:hypothetical protein
MTTLIAWVAFTDTGEHPELPRAVYMASDSRITWGSSGRRWDAGRKLFSPHEQPHLFGHQLRSPRRSRRDSRLGHRLSRFERPIAAG